MRTVAALYIDPRGPYPSMPDVDCWDEARDARLYAGPWPVVAHPPCGPWGRLKHLYKGSEHAMAPTALEQVRRWGGVLEHPAHSRLWDEHGTQKDPKQRGSQYMARPAEGPDCWGGFTVEVNQVEWGHACVKPTWLYFVGVPRSVVNSAIDARPFPGRAPTHGIWYGRFERSGHKGPTLLGASKEIRRRTPPAFAEFLVSLARTAVSLDSGAHTG